MSNTFEAIAVDGGTAQGRVPASYDICVFEAKLHALKVDKTFPGGKFDMLIVRSADKKPCGFGVIKDATSEPLMMFPSNGSEPITLDTFLKDKHYCPEGTVNVLDHSEKKIKFFRVGIKFKTYSFVRLLHSSSLSERD